MPKRKSGNDPARPGRGSDKHQTYIESDEPVEVRIGGGWWFKVWHALVEDGWLARLEGSELKILLALYKHADNTTHLAWPGNTLLQKETGVSRPQVYRALNRLSELGLMERINSGRGNNKTVYKLAPPPKPKSRKKPVRRAVPDEIAEASHPRDRYPQGNLSLPRDRSHPSTGRSHTGDAYKDESSSNNTGIRTTSLKVGEADAITAWMAELDQLDAHDLEALKADTLESGTIPTFLLRSRDVESLDPTTDEWLRSWMARRLMNVMQPR